MKILALVLASLGIATASTGNAATTISANTAIAPAAAEVVTAATENEEDLQAIRGEIIEVELDAETTEASVNEAEVVEEETDGIDWTVTMLADIEEGSSLNIRTEASEDADLAGRLYRGCGAEVVSIGEEWTQIISGDVEGYVKTEYCIFGESAMIASSELCNTTATAIEGGIRVRTESNTEAEILTVLAEGESLEVTEGAEVEDGWVQVTYEGETAYVCADFVEVELQVEEATSIEELEAIWAAEAERKAAEEAAARAEAERKAEAAKQSSAQSSSSKGSGSSSKAPAKTTTGTAVSASADDTTLLAALIMCEAGGESYEGQLAVGAVVMNRVKSGSFPNSISGVIYQSGQFGPASSGKLSRTLSNGNISSSCYQAAQAALSGQDNTGGCKYFHAGTSGNGLVIGSQIFY